jgi:hypothetical protein
MESKQMREHSKSTCPGGAPPSSANPVGARLPTALPRIPYLWSLPTGLADDGSVVDNGCMFQK